MTIIPKICVIPEKKLVGMCQQMVFHYPSIVALWQRFMPRHRQVLHRNSSEFIALQEGDSVADIGKPNVEFEMWATVEVSEVNNIPLGMESITIPEGLHAVFLLKGTDSERLMTYIFKDWLPNSGYELEDRPHFQVMGEAYKNNDPSSEEDFYIPIKLKS